MSIDKRTMDWMLRLRMSCRYARSEDTVMEALDALKGADEAAYKLIRAVPLERQFNACALAAGWPSTLGKDTSNPAEITWTILKKVRLSMPFC